MSEPFVAVLPGPDLPEADHALLVRVAWSRARTRMLAALAVIAIGGLAIGVPAVLHRTLIGDLVALLCAGALVAAVVGAARMPTEAHGLVSLPLMSGADRATRKQVLRAVRRGVPLTGRLGVLADDCARRIVRRGGVPVTYGVVAFGLLAAGALGAVTSVPMLVNAVLLVGGIALAGAAGGWIVLIGQGRRHLSVRDPA